ncbi:DgyrCDS13250 [Dimorphilus gyrociliatus]|nr:DgyrCDS13250 [Dimorphilus gyrociliatus]
MSSSTGATTERFLQGRSALITGSTSGIGLGIAKSLAARGCDILLNGFADETVVNRLKNDISSNHGVNVHFFSTDLAKPEELNEMCNSIKSMYPVVDIIVNNAGFQHVSPIDEFPDEKWHDLLEVLLGAPFRLIKAFLPGMKTQNYGRVINISSAHGIIASPNKSAYVAAKHGLVGLTKVVALETAEMNITCNSICPGYVETPIFEFQVKSLAEKESLEYTEAKKKFLSNFHPSKEAVRVTDVAEMTTFLCTDACRNMTGSQITMDGAWTAK